MGQPLVGAEIQTNFESDASNDVLKPHTCEGSKYFSGIAAIAMIFGPPAKLMRLGCNCKRLCD